jgi:hypothetical protein
MHDKVSKEALDSVQREAITEHVWKWHWRFLGLVALIFGAVSIFGIWAAGFALDSKMKEMNAVIKSIDIRINAFAKVGAVEIAKHLSENQQFVVSVANKTKNSNIRFGIIVNEKAMPGGSGKWELDNESSVGNYTIRFTPPLPHKPTVIVSKYGSGTDYEISVDSADESEMLVIARKGAQLHQGQFSFIAICE